MTHSQQYIRFRFKSPGIGLRGSSPIYTHGFRLWSARSPKSCFLLQRQNCRIRPLSRLRLSLPSLSQLCLIISSLLQYALTQGGDFQTSICGLHAKAHTNSHQPFPTFLRTAASRSSKLLRRLSELDRSASSFKHEAAVPCTTQNHSTAVSINKCMGIHVQ